jgi:hypothetical protein
LFQAPSNETVYVLSTRFAITQSETEYEEDKAMSENFMELSTCDEAGAFGSVSH